MWLRRDDHLIFHGCVPVDEEGRFLPMVVDGEPRAGRALFDALERVVVRSLDTHAAADLDLLWYLWCGPLAPTFGKDRITTLENDLVADPATHDETKNPYFKLIHEAPFCERVLSEFGCDPGRGLIVNGHVPVKIDKGEDPLKRSGKAITIDGAFSEAYGDHGYTLVLEPDRTFLAGTITSSRSRRRCATAWTSSRPSPSSATGTGRGGWRTPKRGEEPREGRDARELAGCAEPGVLRNRKRLSQGRSRRFVLQIDERRCRDAAAGRQILRRRCGARRHSDGDRGDRSQYVVRDGKPLVSPEQRVRGVRLAPVPGLHEPRRPVSGRVVRLPADQRGIALASTASTPRFSSSCRCSARTRSSRCARSLRR